MKHRENSQIVVGWPGHDPGTYGLKGRMFTGHNRSVKQGGPASPVSYIEPSANRGSGIRLFAGTPSRADDEMDHGHHHGGAE